MSTLHLVDPAYRPMAQQPNLDLTAETLPSVRESILEFVAGWREGAPAPSRVAEAPTRNGAPPVPLRIFRPQGGAALKPCLFHIHGGGFVLLNAEATDAANWETAQSHDAVVVSVDYRLAPEAPFPGPIEDCYAGLLWVFNQAAELGLNPERVVVAGESAGGGLAAALALMARDLGEVQLAGQLLIYPMLDHRTGGDEDLHRDPVAGEFSWTRQHNRFGWAAMRGDYDMADERVGWFSPARAADLSNLPPAYVAVGALDLFVNEDMTYARRLSQAGAPVELRLFPGLIHGAESMVPEAEVSRRFFAHRERAMAQLLQGIGL